MMEEGKAVRFGPYELMGIESVLAPSEAGAGAEAGKALPDTVPSRDLVRKIGSALLQAHESRGEVEVALTEREAWCLRERLSIFLSVGQRADVGLTVKLKLYGLLLEFDTARATGDLATADHEERGRREVSDALLYMPGRDGGAHPDGAGDNPGHDTPSPAGP